MSLSFNNKCLVYVTLAFWLNSTGVGRENHINCPFHLITLSGRGPFLLFRGRQNINHNASVQLEITRLNLLRKEE